MTIDIGFAFLSDRITLVDVPGHDRFVRNMVRGVAGISMGLLVVAADDGIMPQTREHYHILRQLGVDRLVVALTKIDLVEADWIALVQEDIRALLAQGSQEGSTIVPVSAQTGEGIEQLRQSLLEEAQQAPRPADRGFFRLTVDRVFGQKGFGAIVTGTVLSGSYSLGTPLELVPGGREVKVRGLQSHGEATERVSLGDRAAFNISNLPVQELGRGEQLATPGMVTAPTIVLARLRLLAEAPALKHNHPVRLNVGTAEVMARVKLPSGKKLQPDQEALVLLDLAGPAPMLAGDRFVARSFSPVTTIGGGVIMDVEPPLKWKDQKRWASELHGLNPAEVRLRTIAAAACRPLTLSRLARRFGYAPGLLKGQWPDSVVTVGRDDDPWVMAEQQLESVTAAIIAALAAHHKGSPYSAGLNREAIRQQIDGNDKFVEWQLKELLGQSKLAVTDDLWSLPEFKVTLSGNEKDLLEQMTALALEQGFTPDYLEVWAQSLKISEELSRTLAGIAESTGAFIRIAPRLMMHKEHVSRLDAALKEHFAAHHDLSVAEFKALTGTSRKLAVPLLEFLDRTGRTVRVGDKRVAPDG